MTGTPCVVSVADHAGWAHVVCVAARASVPAVIERRRVRTIDAGIPTMPYHHESLAMSVTEADALIARVRHVIGVCTLRALGEIVADIAPAHQAAALAIREPVFPSLPDTVAIVRRSYPLQCAADGMMYQQAWCDAARNLGIDVVRGRRGEELARAASALATTIRDIDAFVTHSGRPAGPPWTEEHRRAFAGGIAALATHSPERLRIDRV